MYRTISILALLFIFTSCGDTPDSQPSPSPSSSVKATFEGNLDSVTCDSIIGWIWDSRQPNSPVQLDIYDDETKVDTITASDLRQDLVGAGKGNGVHGFTYQIPAKLKDGKVHAIWAAVPGTDYKMFKGEPKKITCR